jgi:hypothetical protein
MKRSRFNKYVLLALAGVLYLIFTMAVAVIAIPLYYLSRFFTGEDV